MGPALALFFGKVALVVLVLGALTLLVLGRLRRRLRVSPGVASAAPVSWLLSPVLAARLHRRLQSLVRAVRTATAGRRRLLGPARVAATASARLAADLEREAVAVDHRLVPAAKLGPLARRAELSRLSRDVNRLDDLARRVIALAADERQRPAIVGGTAIDDLASRVERLEAARAELTIIETDAHLATPPELSA